MKNKKIMSLILVAVATFTFMACNGDNEEKKTSNNTMALDEVKGTIIPREDFHLVHASPKDYIGSEVEFYGKIFADVEKDTKGTYMQIFSNEDGSDNNVLVGIEDTSLNVKSGDIVFVKGKVKGEEKGTNMFGAELKLPVILASSVEISDYGTAFSPSSKTIEVNQEQNQHGYKLTLKSVEIAENETRANIKIENTSNEKITFYSFNSVLTQGSSQIEQEDNWNAGYKEVSSEILPGIVEEGVVTFKPVDVNGGDFNIIFEGNSENYSFDFEPFNFHVHMN